MAAVSAHLQNLSYALQTWSIFLAQATYCAYCMYSFACKTWMREAGGVRGGKPRAQRVHASIVVGSFSVLSAVRGLETPHSRDSQSGKTTKNIRAAQLGLVVA